MGFPTFTFETDDEQFIPGSFQDLNDRLDEELDVMRYLIENVSGIGEQDSLLTSLASTAKM